MTHILFVCTGNVFRSLTAELALKSILPKGSAITVASAGLSGFAGNELLDGTKERLTHHGLDYRQHVSRRLTQELLDDADLVVAMGTDHSDYIRSYFTHYAPLYLEVATGAPDGILDLWEAVPDYHSNRKAALRYVDQTIDMIVGHRDAFLNNLPTFLQPNLARASGQKHQP